MDWHRKPPAEVRSLTDAIQSAERREADLALIVQVHASDWDTVILSDEVKRLWKLVAHWSNMTYPQKEIQREAKRHSGDN